MSRLDLTQPKAAYPAVTPRRTLLLGLLAGAALNLTSCKSTPQADKSDGSDLPPIASTPGLPAARVVSLSPGVTETIIALGRANDLVGLSDYCHFEAESAPKPPRLGSAITPNYEAIARVQPTVIIASEVAGDQLKPLSRLAPTHSLPWLTLNELTSSIKVLGALIQAEPQAEELAKKLHAELSVTPRADAPRILLALDYGDSGSNDTWFIRKNSIHGAVLRAAGARNAVARDISGQPKLSPEQLMALDPDAIIVLRSSAPDAASEARNLKHFRRWTPLRAVKENRIRVLSLEGSLSVGPGVLDVTSRLRQVVDELTPRENDDASGAPSKVAK